MFIVRRGRAVVGARAFPVVCALAIEMRVPKAVMTAPGVRV